MYADESAHDDVLYLIGALVADAAAIVHLQSSLDRIGRIVSDEVAGFDAATEFHAYDMFHGERAWDAVPPSLRAKACVLTSKAIARSGARFILRGLNLTRLDRRYRYPFPPHELAFAQALESAEELLESLGDHAMVVADEHHTAEDGRRRFRRMRADTLEGYSGRQITHLVDTVYFGPSHHSRLLQAADVATYFTCRRRWKPLEEENIGSATSPAHDRRIAVFVHGSRRCLAQHVIGKTRNPARGGVSAGAGVREGVLRLLVSQSTSDIVETFSPASAASAPPVCR